ncbi:MAG: ester cyclase [Acidobacteriaceae bacterium]
MVRLEGHEKTYIQQSRPWECGNPEGISTLPILCHFHGLLRSEAELWSKGNLSVADELYSPDFVCHFVGGIEWTGLNGIKSAVLSHRTSFPDWHEKVEDIIAEGDRVVIRITSTGTQLGEFAGIAPTGKRVTIEEFHIFRLAGGKIVEQWGMPDVQGLMTQLNASSVDKRRIP